MQLSCPTADRLREFLEGSVGDAEANQISGHVVECPSCDSVLGTLESEQNDVLKTLREGVRTESLLQEPEFEQLRNTARFSQADTTALSVVDEHSETGKRLRDYRLVKKIGEGGMGTVYQAFHVHLAKHVALKILPSDKLRSKQSVARFRQEMRAVGQVNHPNVVSASDAGTIDGQHFLVMELVQGADLARIIHDRGPLNVADACEIVRQAAIGLQHAHDNGLVHRDVKPSNIMLTLDGSLKLLDLGLAGLNNSEFESTASVVVTDRLTSVGQIMGTLDYMAPEQITASPQVDGKADIYALGATLFQLLTGRTPCGDRSEGTPQRIEAVLHKPPLDIRALRNDLPEELCALLLKMLAKNPEDRPQAAIDAAGELERFTSDADLVTLAEACRTSLDMPSADVDVTDDVSFVVSRAEPQAHIPAQRPFPFPAVALAGLFLSLLAAVVYYIVTNNGVVQIEVFDDSVKVAIDDQTVTVNEGNNQPIKLWPGEHKLVVSVGESELITDKFEIRRNGEIAFKVKLLPGTVVVSKEGKKHKSSALPDDRPEKSGAEAVATDSDIELKPIRDELSPRQAETAFKFRKLSTTKKDDFKHARVAVSIDHQAAISRNYLVTGGEDVRGRIRAYLWSLDPDNPIRTRLPDSTTFGFIPNTKLAYQVSWGDGVLVWDTRTHMRVGEALPHEQREGSIIHPAVSPDGSTLVARSEMNQLQFWDLRSRKEKGPALELGGAVSAMAFSPDGKWFFTTSRPRKLTVWDRHGKLVAGPFRHDLIYRRFPYASATGQFATAENNDKNEQVWKSELVVRHGEAFGEVSRVQFEGHIREVRWVGDTHLLVVSDDKEPGEEGPYDYGRKVARLVSLAEDSPMISTLLRYEWIRSINISPDGEHFAIGTREETSCWKLGNQEPIWTKPGDHLVSFGDRNWVLLQTGGVATACSLRDGKELWRKENIDKSGADGAHIWTCSEGEIEFWLVERDEEASTNREKSRLLRSRGTNPVQADAQSPDETVRSVAKRNSSYAGSYVAAPDKAFLSEKNVKATTHELWRIIQNPQLPPYEVPIEKWLKPFDEADDEEASIIRHDMRLRLLFKGMNSFSYDHSEATRDNPKFVNDIENVLKEEHEASLPRVVQAAIRLLDYQNAHGFSKRLLEHTPAVARLDNRALNLTLLQALTENSFYTDGSPIPEMVSAAKSQDESRRAFAIRTLIRRYLIKPDEATKRFKTETKYVRWHIAMGLIDLKRKEAVPALIELIPDVSGDRASYLEKLLHHIAGNGPNPTLGGDKESRAKAKKQWLDWWKKNAERISSSQISHGHTFVHNRLLVGEIDLAGEMLWEVDVRAETDLSFHRAVLHPNGNFAVAESYSAFPHQRRSSVYEFSRTGAVLWKHQFGTPASIDILCDGRILVASVNTLRVFDRERKPKTVLPPDDNRNFQYFTGKPDGGFAAIGFGAEEKRIDDMPFGDLVELDAGGKVTKATRVDAGGDTPTTWIFEFLPNGHMLVSRDHDVVELDQNRKVARTVISDIDFTIRAIQRLANGNILLGNYSDDMINEYSPDGKLVGETKLPKKYIFVRRR